MALAGFALALHKERFARFGYGFTVALLTFPIVAIPGAHASTAGPPCCGAPAAALMTA